MPFRTVAQSSLQVHANARVGVMPDGIRVRTRPAPSAEAGRLRATYTRPGWFSWPPGSSTACSGSGTRTSARPTRRDHPLYPRPDFKRRVPAGFRDPSGSAISRPTCWSTTRRGSSVATSSVRSSTHRGPDERPRDGPNGPARASPVRHCPCEADALSPPAGSRSAVSPPWSPPPRVRPRPASPAPGPPGVRQPPGGHRS